LEPDSIDRIRSATFPIGRRGYEKREVDRFLTTLADWLETGGADQSRAEIIRRDLERVGEQTGKILVDAHDAAEALRADAEVEAERIAAEAAAQAAQSREAADRYAAETRAAGDADAETARVRAAEIRGRAERDAEQTVARAESEAKRTLDAANRRREDIEAVISDLEERRDTVIAEMERLSSELAGSATHHRHPDQHEVSSAADAG
jgi:DivIVA domain-containing protein